MSFEGMTGRIAPQVAEIPWIDRAQMVEVDRAMVEDFRIELIQMMENAGSNLARLARQRFFDGEARGKRVVVLAGTGGNGGGALVCARHLVGWGAEVAVYTTAPDAGYDGVPAHQLSLLRRRGVAIERADALEAREAAAPHLIIDGLIGYGLEGAPRGYAATAIRWATGQETPILSLDAPSGLDVTRGEVSEPAIHATATMTLALPKKGLRGTGAQRVVGELYLADISVPPALYRRPPLSLDVPAIFERAEIVRLS